MSMRPVRWGIVGAGRIAETFANDMRFVEGAEIRAVASRTATKARQFAKKHGILRAVSDYRELFEADDIDVVYIATPHVFHEQQSSCALKAAKAVLCEKPLTVNPDQSARLIAVAKDQGQYLMEALWTWFLPAVQQAKRWVDAGRIGTVNHVRADFGNPMVHFDPEARELNPDLGGGCLLDMGIYPIAMATLFIPGFPNIRAAAHWNDTGVEDDVAMVLDYGSAIASLATSFRGKMRNECQIIGEEGTIVLPDFWRASRCMLFEGEVMVDDFDDYREGSGFEFQIRSVVNDLQAQRKESPIVPLAISQHLQDVMAEVRRCISLTSNAQP